MAFAMAGLASKAQLSIAPTIGYGYAMGNYKEANPNASLDTAFSSKFGFNINVGAEAHYRLCKDWSIHSGFFYQYIDTKNGYTNTGSTIDYERKMNYVSMPLELVYGKKGIGFYGGAGIDLGFGLGGKVTESGTNLVSQTTILVFDGKSIMDNYDHFNALDLGIALKAGYTFSNNIIVGVDAKIGLNNLSSNPAPYNSGNYTSYKLTTISAHIGYLLYGPEHHKLKKKKKKVDDFDSQ